MKVLIGSGGITTCISISSVPGLPLGIAPQKITKPVGGGSLKSLTRFATFSIAPRTFFLVVLDLMFEAVLYSWRRYVVTSLICLPGGTYSEINSVPRPSFEASVSSNRLSLKTESELRSDTFDITHM